jgi:hypothetical protein
MRRKLPPVRRVMARAASPSAGSGLVGESDPAVERWVAGELPFESGHADQDEADVVAVEVVAELFQALGFQPVCFVAFTARLGWARWSEC